MISRLGPRATVAPGARRKQCLEAGGQIDVHVAAHIGVAAHPGFAKRKAAALTVEVQHIDLVERGGEVPCHIKRAVSAGVVGNGDAPGEREVLGEVRVEPRDAGLEYVGLVVHRYDDVEHRWC
jgi:hypothetical protein